MKRIIALAISVAIMLSIAIPVSAGAVSAVTGLKQISGGDNQIEFSWDSILGTDVRYNVELSQDGANWVNYGNTSNAQMNVRDLNSGKSYYARVRAEQNNEFGEYSEPVEMVTAPENTKNVIQTDATTSSATITWDAVDGATSYKVCEWIDGDYEYATTTDTKFTFTGLKNTNDFEYDVYVRTVRTSATGFEASTVPGYSMYLSDIKVSGGLKLVPKKMLAPKVTSYFSSIGVIYTDTVDVPFEDGKQIVIYNNKGKKISEGSDWRYSGISGGQFDKIRVRAYCSFGPKNTVKYGKWSDYTYFCNGIGSVSVNAGKTKASASWNKVKGATNYTVYLCKSGKAYKKVTTTKKCSATIKKYGKTKLKKGTSYTVKVVANKKVGKKTFKSTEATYSFTTSR